MLTKRRIFALTGVVVIIVIVLMRRPRPTNGPPFDRDDVVRMLHDDLEWACRFQERAGGVGTASTGPLRIEVRGNETMLCATTRWNDEAPRTRCYDDATTLAEDLSRTCLLYWQEATGIYKLPY